MDYTDLVKYVVRIKAKGCGSSVIVNPKNSKYAYVLTAKHVIENIPYDDIIIEHIDNSIQVVLKCCNLITVNIGKIYKQEDDGQEDDGVVILILEKDAPENEEYLNKIDSLSIVNSDFDECITIGYPALERDDHQNIEAYSCRYERQVKQSCCCEVRSEKRLNMFGKSEHETIEGLSGAGLFAKDCGGKEHLVGIPVQTKGTENLVCIDLRIIAEEINKRLEERKLEPIELTDFYYFKTITIDPRDLDFEELKKKLLKNKKAKEYIDDEDKLERFRKDVESSLKILADAYLYRGIICHQEKNNRKATNNFKKAEKYCLAHRYYFWGAKHQRKKDKGEQLNQEQLHSEKEQINNILTNDSIIKDKEQKIKLLERLISINEESHSTRELEENCLELLNLYHQSQESQDEHLTRMGEISYQLADLYNKQKDYWNGKNYLLKSIEYLKDCPEKSIKSYRKLIAMLHVQKEYQKARDIGLQAKQYLETKKGNLEEDEFIKKMVCLYDVLIIVTYNLAKKEESTEIDSYYQGAKKCLEKLNKHSKLYQSLSTKIENTWLIIKSRTIAQCVLNLKTR